MKQSRDRDDLKGSLRALLIGAARTSATHLCALLRADGYLCDVTDLDDGVVEIGSQGSYDVIILERGSPGAVPTCDDGHAVLRKLRAARVTAPVLILSDQDEPGDTAKLLRGGADDYLSRPFDNREVVARTKAIFRRDNRRHSRRADAAIEYGALTIDCDARSAMVGGQALMLTPMEYRVLELLGRRIGVPLAKERIAGELYEGRSTPKPKCVDAFVGRLRTKLAQVSDEDISIRTVRGQGYMLAGAEVASA